MKLRCCAAPVLLVAVLLAVGSCNDGDDGDTQITFEPGREDRGEIHVLRLQGTPYEMGYQHGSLMADVLAEGVDYLDSDPMFYTAQILAREDGFIEEAEANALPAVLDECRGLSDAAGEQGVAWTMDKCLLLAYGATIIEHLSGILGKAACSQFSAAGSATTDGKLIHGRSMDWADIRYLVEHPALIVRRPAEGVPSVVVGFPGNVSPYTGVNDAGLFVASNENDAVDDIDREGVDHTQMTYHLVNNARTLEEAEAYLKSQNHTTCESVMVSDSASGTAASFEMTANHMGIRRMSADGVLYMTNHFVHPDMVELHVNMGTQSTTSRLMRLQQLLEPGGADSVHGALDPPGAVGILRDTYNPLTGVTHPPELFDGGGSLANNHNVHVMVWVPEHRSLYVSLGEIPVPPKPFIGFHLDELLGIDVEASAAPARFE